MLFEGLTDLGQAAFHPGTLRVLNLVQNALDAMPQGGTLTLAGQATATHIHLRVRDTGMGFLQSGWGRFLSRCIRRSPAGPGSDCTLCRKLQQRMRDR